MIRKESITHEEFTKKLKKIHPNLEIISKLQYKRHSKIQVKDKYGICEVLIQPLMRGSIPTIKTAINPTEYWINQAKEVHGNLYDYTLVNYKTNNVKVKIICPIHGEFLQYPSAHLQKHGCAKCSYENNKGTWNYSIWEKAGLKSKNFTGFKVYILECWNDKEKFYKIGKTYLDIGKRYAKHNDLPYEWKVIKIHIGSSKYISELEKKLIKFNKEYKYLPQIHFDGKYECFTKIKKINKLCFK